MVNGLTQRYASRMAVADRGNAGAVQIGAMPVAFKVRDHQRRDCCGSSAQGKRQFVLKRHLMHLVRGAYDADVSRDAQALHRQKHRNPKRTSQRLRRQALPERLRQRHPLFASCTPKIKSRLRAADVKKPPWAVGSCKKCSVAIRSQMIKSFRHKGIRRFFETGSTAGIQAQHAARLKVQLAALNRAIKPSDMNAPGWKLHLLKGKNPKNQEMSGHWSISVNGNWRLTFKFDAQDVILVDYQDYH